MNKFKYLKISNTKKIRYFTNYYKKNLYIVFLHGFMSDLEGEKPKAFLKYCKKKKLGFLGLEYSGHGKSSGKFINGNISKWSKEIKIMIKKIVKKNNFILVGSSMGSWLAINQFKHFQKHMLSVKDIRKSICCNVNVPTLEMLHYHDTIIGQHRTMHRFAFDFFSHG